MTERAWRPEPPCDWLIFTSSPVFFFQYSANDLLKSTYSSRVGSYDTLSRVISRAWAACPTPPTNTAAVIASSSRRFQ
jgi:hypothetical protein